MSISITKVSTKIVVFFVSLFILITTLILTLWLMLKNAEHTVELYDQHIESDKLANELRRSSDELTRMAQSYVVTGDKRFKNYFRIISDIRDGKEPRPDNYDYSFWDRIAYEHNYVQSSNTPISIETLIEKLQFSDYEIQKLNDAKKLSDRLIKIEEQAFNAAEGLFKDKSGHYTLLGQPDFKLAADLVYNERYHLEKANIMNKIDEFISLLEHRIESEMVLMKQKQHRLLNTAIIISFILFIICLSGNYYLRKIFIGPIKEMLGWVSMLENEQYNIRSSIQRNDELGQLAKAIITMSHKIELNINRLKRATQIDYLTQIYNRHYIDNALNTEKDRFERYGTECSIIMVDIDHFKLVNDKFGHQLGDDVLITIANTLGEVLRKTDKVGRWGGEEFIVICSNSNYESAVVIAEKLRKKISTLYIPPLESVTASFGVGSFQNGRSLKETLQIIDMALYLAKAHGRNQVKSMFDVPASFVEAPPQSEQPSEEFEHNKMQQMGSYTT